MQFTVEDALGRNETITVTIEGYNETEKGTRPDSIFTEYDGPQLNIQFSNNGFNYDDENNQYTPTPEKYTIYSRTVKDDDFEDPRNVILSIIFERVVIPAYNEWRLQNGLDWSPGIGPSNLETPPISKKDY